MDPKSKAEGRSRMTKERMSSLPPSSIETVTEPRPVGSATTNTSSLGLGSRYAFGVGDSSLISLFSE